MVIAGQVISSKEKFMEKVVIAAEYSFLQATGSGKGKGGQRCSPFLFGN